jgi:hypothetical protein
MKQHLVIVTVAALLTASCDWDTSGTDGIKYIEYDIAASTWERTEDNSLYIKDKGVWQSPIQYTHWQSGGSYPYDKMLTLKGGVPDETLKHTGE